MPATSASTPARIVSATLPAAAPQMPTPIAGSSGTNTPSIATVIAIIAFELEADLSFIGLVPGGELG